MEKPDDFFFIKSEPISLFCDCIGDRTKPEATES